MSLLFTQYIYYNFLRCFMIKLLYLPQKNFRQYRIFKMHIPFFLRDVIFQFNRNGCEDSQFDFLIWFNLFLLLVKFPLKDKMHSTTQYDTRVNSSLIHPGIPTILCEKYHCSLSCGWMSYELLRYVQFRVCVYWVRRVIILSNESFYMDLEEHLHQSHIKTSSSHQIQSYDKGDNWSSFRCIFQVLNSLLI